MLSLVLKHSLELQVNSGVGPAFVLELTTKSGESQDVGRPRLLLRANRYLHEEGRRIVPRCSLQVHRSRPTICPRPLDEDDTTMSKKGSVPHSLWVSAYHQSKDSQRPASSESWEWRRPIPVQDSQALSS